MNRYGLKYRLSFDDKATWIDLDGHVNSQNTTITYPSLSSSYKSSIGTCKFEVIHKMTQESEAWLNALQSNLLLAKLNNTKAWFKLVSVDDGTETPVFFGTVDTSNISRTISTYAQGISLTAYDNLKLLDEKMESSFAFPTDPFTYDSDNKVNGIGNGLYLFRASSSNFSADLVGKILASQGYSAADVDFAKSETIYAKNGSTIRALPYVSYDEDDSLTCRNFLDTLLYDNLAYISAGTDGKFIIRSFKMTAVKLGNVIGTAKYLTKANALTIGGSQYTYNGLKLSWSNLSYLKAKVYDAGFGVNLAIEEGQLVNEGYVMAPHEYYPGGADGTDPIYQEFSDEWLDRKYLAKITEERDKDISLLCVRNFQNETQRDAAITVSPNPFSDGVANPTYYPLKMRAAFYNSSATENKKFESFRVYGDCLYRAKNNETTYPATANDKNIEEYASTYIFSEESAENFIESIYNFKHNGSMVYKWQQKVEAKPGQIWRVNPTGAAIDTLVFVSSVTVRFTGGEWLFEIEAIGVSSIESALAKTSSTIVGFNYSDSVKPVSSVTTYGSSSAENVEPTSWSSTLPATGTYVWTKVVVTYSDGSTQTTKSVAKREAGATPQSSATTYGTSSSSTVEPSSWSSTLPTTGAYIWTKITVTYSDGTTQVSKSVMKRESSATPTGTATTYGSSDSASTEPASWSSSLPTTGIYLWTKVTVSYSDGSEQVSKTVTKMVYDTPSYHGQYLNSAAIDFTPISGDTVIFLNQSGGATANPSTYRYQGSSWVEDQTLLAEHAQEIIAYAFDNHLDYTTLTVNQAYIAKLVGGNGSFNNMNVVNFHAEDAHLTKASVQGMLDASQNGSTVLQTFVSDGQSTYTQPNVSFTAFALAYQEYHMLQSLADYVGAHGTKATQSGTACWSMTISGTYRGTAFTSVKIGAEGLYNVYLEASVTSGVLKLGCQNYATTSASTPGNVEVSITIGGVTRGITYSREWTSTVFTYSGYSSGYRFFSMSPFSSMPNGTYPATSGSLNGTSLVGVNCTKTDNGLVLGSASYSVGGLISAFTLTSLVLNTGFTGVMIGDVVPIGSGKNLGRLADPFNILYSNTAQVGGILYDSNCFAANSSGVLKLPNKWKIVFGHNISVNSSNQSNNITLAQAFTSAFYTVVVTPKTQNTSDAYARCYTASIPSGVNSYFTFWQKDKGKITAINYIAIGVDA